MTQTVVRPRRLTESRTKTLLAALLPVLVFLLTFFLLGCRYEVNDDATLSNIASGAYGPDSQYLIYVNVVLGWLFRPFYALVPGLNWYVILQVALDLVCFSVLCRLLMDKAGLKHGLLLSLGLLLTFGVDAFHAFQYVKNSGLYLVTGLLLIALNLGRLRPALFGGLALAAVGSMLRFDNFYAVGGLSAGLLLLFFFRLDKKGKLRAVGTMLVLFVLVFGLKALDTAVYQANEDWRSYQRFNDVRTYISDFRLQFLDNPALVAEFGYNINDYWMIERWAYFDPQVFPVETLEDFAALLPRNSIRAAAMQSVHTGLGFLYREPIFLFLGLTVLGWLLFADKRSWPAAVCTGGILALQIFYLSFQGREVHRVEWVLALAAAVFLIFLSEAGRRPCKTAVLGGALAVLTAALCFQTAVQWADLRQYPARHPAVIPAADAMSADKEHLYLLDVDAFSDLSGYDLWRAKPKDYFSNIVCLGGWLSGSPFDKATLARYGFDRNPYAALASGDERVLLGDPYSLSIKETYLKEHYGVSGSFQEVQPAGPFRPALYRLETP